QPDAPVFIAPSREQVRGGGANGGGVGETQANEVALGLVRDRVATELDRHGGADLLRRGGGCRGGGDQSPAGDRDVVSGQQLLRGVLGERPGRSHGRAGWHGTPATPSRGGSAHGAGAWLECPREALRVSRSRRDDQPRSGLRLRAPRGGGRRV